MDRYLVQNVKQDLEWKIVLVSGPRQSGKTTLAKSLFPGQTEYLNCDNSKDLAMIKDQAWQREGREIIIFDELHKMPQWKQYIKGIYDTEGTRPKLLVTGSARLEISRKGGDSLAGRFFHYRLHPFSLTETKTLFSADEALDVFLEMGPFPEPFLRGSSVFAKRWQLTHLDAILRGDLIDIENVSDIKKIELLVELLGRQVGVPVSHASLARALQVSPHTIKRWIDILEMLYVIFIVTPFHSNISRSLLKEPKIYFYDFSRVQNSEGARIENLVASSLLKRNHFLTDTTGEKIALHYIRDHQKREVDFLTLRNGSPEYMIEVKLSDDTPAAPLYHYSTQVKPAETIQLVKNIRRKKDFPLGKTGTFFKIRKIADWLACLEA